MPPKRSPARALRIGRALAEQALKRRETAHRARTRAVAAHRAPVTRAITARGSSALAPADTLHSMSAGIVIAEGDSWFDYPLHDVLKDLEDLYGYDVESVAHWGDTVEDMAYGDGQLDEFARRVEKVLRGGVKPKAILLSAGGNDVAGDQFAQLLNYAVSAHAGLNQEIVSGIIDQRVYDSYVTILAQITAVCKSLIGEVVPIIVHGYAYAVPDGRGLAGGWWLLPGPWLEPGFSKKGYPKAARLPIVKQLIDRFNDMLLALTKTPQFTHVEYLDLRSVLPSGGSYKTYWANELHPTPQGFEAVTKKFAALIG